MRMNGDFIELELDAVVDAGNLLAFLPSNAAIGASECDGIIRVYWPKELWSPGIMEELEIALQRLGVNRETANLRVQEVASRDWNETWIASIQPIRIGKRVLVRQSWNSVEVPQDMVELVIDPKRAFGSGYHATSQLLAEWIADEIRGGEKVLDIGTGSGILAMTALRCGAARAVGIDNDEMAIECARENAVLNGLGAELELRLDNAEDIGVELFDLIVANIDRKTLLAFVARLGKNLRRGGRILLSGLLAEDCADLADSIAAAGGRVTKVRKQDEWIAAEVHFPGC